MVDPEEIGQKYGKFVKYGVYGAGALTFLVATYSFVVTAAISLMVWAGLCAGVFVLYSFAPVFATYIANKKMQLLVAVIEANPIETMQNLYAEKLTEADRQDHAITAFDTEFQNVNSLVDDLRRTDPEEAIQYAEMRDKMKEGLVSLRAEQQAATGELKSFKSQIDKARRIYKVANAMNAALESSQSAQQKVFADIKEQVSFDKVRSDLNHAFANLNSAVERRKNAAMFATPTKAALPEPQVEVFDITKGKVLQKVVR